MCLGELGGRYWSGESQTRQRMLVGEPAGMGTNQPRAGHYYRAISRLAKRTRAVPIRHIGLAVRRHPGSAGEVIGHL